MLKKLKQLSLTIASLTLLVAPVAIPVSVHATSINDSLCNGIDVANGGDSSADASGTASNCQDNTGSSSFNSVVHTVINLFSWIVGVISVIMIIVGGFKYITSGGKDSSVGSAKSTIMYALIGLVVVALAQVIVRFVLTNAKV